MAHPNLCPLSPAHRCNCFHHCLHTVIIEPACNDHWAHEGQPELSSAPWAVPRCVPPRRHFVSWCQAGRTGSVVYRELWAPAHSLPLPLLPQQRPQGPGAAGTFLSRGADSPGPSWGAFVPLLTSIPCRRSHRPLGPHAKRWAPASVRRRQPEKAAPRLCLQPGP